MEFVVSLRDNNNNESSQCSETSTTATSSSQSQGNDVIIIPNSHAQALLMLREAAFSPVSPVDVSRFPVKSTLFSSSSSSSCVSGGVNALNNAKKKRKKRKRKRNRKRKRTHLAEAKRRYNKAEHTLLRAVFAKKTYPSAAQKTELALKCNRTLNQINNYFSNLRRCVLYVCVCVCVCVLVCVCVYVCMCVCV